MDHKWIIRFIIRDLYDTITMNREWRSHIAKDYINSYIWCVSRGGDQQVYSRDTQPRKIQEYKYITRGY